MILPGGLLKCIGAVNKDNLQRINIELVYTRKEIIQETQNNIDILLETILKSRQWDAVCGETWKYFRNPLNNYI